MVKVAVYNFDYCQGSTYRFSVTPFTNVELTNPLDLTGSSVRGQIRVNAQSADYVPMVCTVNGNRIDVEIPADALVGSRIPITGKTYKDTTQVWYDVEIVYPSGDVRRILQGTIKVSPEVTRDG